MKKIYFAGKFKIEKDKNKNLNERLENDYRAKLIGDKGSLCCSKSSLRLDNEIVYVGPFYCEQASNGDFTSSDCNVVLDAEYNFVKNCDICLAVLDESFSVGTIVELGWAIQKQKKIVIFYKEEESNYNIKSEYWFVIADVIKRSKHSKIFVYKNFDDVIEKIKYGNIFNW